MELNTDHFWPYFLVYPLSFGQILFLYIFIWMLSLDVLFYSIWYNIELYFYVSIELVFWILWNSTFMYVFFISYSWYLLLTLSVITIYVLSYVFVLFLESCCDLLFAGYVYGLSFCQLFQRFSILLFLNMALFAF